MFAMRLCNAAPRTPEGMVLFMNLRQTCASDDTPSLACTLDARRCLRSNTHTGSRTFRVFNTWHSNVEFAKHARNTMENILYRMIHRGLSTAFVRWSENACSIGDMV